MPQLTAEQKEHFKESQRATQRINETWALFTMFLQTENRPQDALEKARQAVSVWAEFMEANSIDPPEIEPADPMRMMMDVAHRMGESLAGRGDIPAGAVALRVQDGELVGLDVEFLREEPGGEGKK